MAGLFPVQKPYISPEGHFAKTLEFMRLESSQLSVKKPRAYYHDLLSRLSKGLNRQKQLSAETGLNDYTLQIELNLIISKQIPLFLDLVNRLNLAIKFFDDNNELQLDFKYLLVKVFDKAHVYIIMPLEKQEKEIVAFLERLLDALIKINEESDKWIAYRDQHLPISEGPSLGRGYS